MSAPHQPTPALGSAEWLNKEADVCEKLHHALGSIDEEDERETKRRILGLRDAARDLAAAQARVKELEAELFRCEHDFELLSGWLDDCPVAFDACKDEARSCFERLRSRRLEARALLAGTEGKERAT